MKVGHLLILILVLAGGLITAVNLRGLADEVSALKLRVVTLEANQGNIIDLVLEGRHK